MVLICILLSFMCLFTSIGYAAISGTITVMGSTHADPPTAIFITDVSGGAYIDPDTLSYTGTVVTSNLVMKPDANGVYEAKFSVTVFNNTTETYYYLAMVRGTYTTGDGSVATYSNENIELTPDIAMAEEIKPGQMRTFTVTAAFADDATDKSNPTLFSIIDYQFSTTKPENKDEAAVAGVLEKFPEILNDTNGDYKKLTSAMNSLSINRWSSSYIGNGGGANDKDAQAIKDLFGENMMLNIDGENKPVTVMIKKENVDGNRNTGEDTDAWVGPGKEMTLYITADPLSRSGGSAIVYVVVYTKAKGSNEWYQIGTTFTGTAPIVSYFGTSGTGSFDTDKWKSTDGKAIEDLV